PQPGRQGAEDASARPCLIRRPPFALAETARPASFHTYIHFGEILGREIKTMTIHDASRRSMGHTALHYPKAEDAKAAERLLTLLGFIKTQELPLPAGAFYRFVTANQHQARGDGIVYVSAC